MATTRPVGTASQPFFFQELRDAGADQELRLIAQMGTYPWTIRLCNEAITNPPEFVNLFFASIPQLVRTANGTDWHPPAAGPDEIDDTQTRRSFFFIIPAEIEQLDETLIGLLKQLSADQGEPLTQVATAFSSFLRQIEENNDFIDSLGSPPFPPTRELKRAALRAGIEMNLADIGQTENALVHGCQNAQEVAARVITFLQTRIEETPITSQLQATTDLATQRMIYVVKVVLRSIQHLARLNG